MNFILNLLFPKKCLGCGKFGTYFCQDCIQNIPQNDLVCPNCQRLSIGGTTHPICRKKFGLDGLWSLGAYQDPLKKAIQKLKYEFVSSLAQALNDLIIEYWAKYPPYILDLVKKTGPQNWLIVPVPLFITRQNWRGFNQSALLGQFLSKSTGIRYVEALTRTRPTKSQAKLSSSARRQNIKGAISLSKNYELKTKNYIIVDDVWTTGSTLRECAYVLKHAGAKQVWAITLAC